jgi:hypothetical protein
MRGIGIFPSFSFSYSFSFSLAKAKAWLAFNQKGTSKN